MDINHSRYISSHHSSKPNKYDGSARVSLQESIPLAAPESTSQIKRFESPSKLCKELATTPPDRKTSHQNMSIYMDNHSSSPTVTTATLKRYEPIRKMVEYEASHMEFLSQFYIRRNNYDVPSRVRHHKKALKMSEYEQSVMITDVLYTNMMICRSGYINSHQVQEEPKPQQKTSSDSGATQDPDLARDEGLHPREGITRHHALPVPPRATQDAVRPTQQLLNLIAAGQVIKVFVTQLLTFVYVSEFLI